MRKGKNRPVLRDTTFQGLPIAVEFEAGHIMEWSDTRTRRSGTTKMWYPYGFIRGTEGVDGAGVDCWVGPVPSSEEVYVVHQNAQPFFDQYAEDKVLFGFESPKQAKVAYELHFDDPKFFGSMEVMPVSQFKEKYLPTVKKGFGPPGAQAMQPQLIMDVDSIEGVGQLLGLIRGFKDEQLAELARLVWGPGFKAELSDPLTLKEELIGFLLDQRDLLGQAPELHSRPPLVASNTSTNGAQGSQKPNGSSKPAASPTG